MNQKIYDKLLRMIPRLATIIKKEGLLSVNASSHDLNKRKNSLARYLIDQRLVTPVRLAEMIAKRTGYRHITSIEMLQVDADIFDRVPMGVFRWFDAFPISMADDSVQVVLVDPTDQVAIQQLHFFTACRVKPMVASLDFIEHLFERFQPHVKLSSLASYKTQSPGSQVESASSVSAKGSVRPSKAIVAKKDEPAVIESVVAPVPSVPELQQPVEPTEIQQNFDPLPLDFKSLQEVDDDIESSMRRPVSRPDPSFEMHRDPDSIHVPLVESQEISSDESYEPSFSAVKVDDDLTPSFEAVETPNDVVNDSLPEINFSEDLAAENLGSETAGQSAELLETADLVVEETQLQSSSNDMVELATGLHPGVAHLNQLLVKVSLQSNPQKLFEVISDSCVKIGIHSGVLFTLQLMESGSCHCWTLDKTNQRVTQDEMPESLEDLGMKTIMELIHSDVDADWVSLSSKLEHRWQMFSDAWPNPALPPTHFYSTPTKTGQKLVAMMRFSGLSYHKTLMMTSIQVLKAAAKRL